MLSYENAHGGGLWDLVWGPTLPLTVVWEVLHLKGTDCDCFETSSSQGRSSQTDIAIWCANSTKLVAFGFLFVIFFAMDIECCVI